MFIVTQLGIGGQVASDANMCPGETYLREEALQDNKDAERNSCMVLIAK